MHGSLAENAALLEKLLAANIASNRAVVCVPFPYLSQVGALLQGSALAWGAQDVSEYLKGAYTGEVSAPMLAEFGAGYVIVGHSERRALFGETSQQVATKVVRAIAAGIKPIVCVGETLVERESDQTEAVVASQLAAVLDQLTIEELAHVTLAYEPVWAIGTGKTASPAEAQAVHAFLRGLVAQKDAGLAAGVRLLYGGSVKSSNAAELFAQDDIDGGLIGGAALVADDFVGIIAAAGA